MLIWHVSEFNFMQITRLFFGSQRFLKTGNNDSTVIYVSSGAIEIILTSQCPFELFCIIFPVMYQSIRSLNSPPPPPPPRATPGHFNFWKIFVQILLPRPPEKLFKCPHPQKHYGNTVLTFQ